MPTLDWIGKNAVENHHLEIPYRMLKCDPDLSVGDVDSGNLIVQGDNLEALKALLPYYAGKVKCIYIDPPYNTGFENWAYNDNVKSPEIIEWLEKVIGIDDLSRHDKWLCMMYPRLKLLKNFLKEDGLIFISIDDNEYANLKLIMDEIYGNHNFIINFIWKKKSTSTNVKGAHVSSLTDYILVYGRSNSSKIKQRIRLKETRKYPYKDIEGNFRTTIIEKKHAGSYKRDSMRYKILGLEPRVGKRWQIGEESARELEIKNRFIKEDGIIKLKIYDFEDKDTVSAQPNLLDNCGTTDRAARLLNNEMFGHPELFDNPKPIELLNHIINISSNNKSLILDSFSGSGTTAHSVLALNNEFKCKRNFILIEMSEKICKEITSERVKKVINGYFHTKRNGELEEVKGLGGSFKYCVLDKPLFDEFGNIRSDVKFKDLAYHIFFSETGTPLASNAKIGKTPFIGTFKESAFYLLFNGILGDKSVNGGNVLTSLILEKLPKYSGRKIIFGEGCRLSSQRLRKENIIFKQIPYEIKVK